MEPIQSTINNLPLLPSLTAFSLISPSPFILSSQTYVQFSDLHDALLRAIRSLLLQYPQNATLQHLLPLHPRIRKLFVSAPPTCSHLGSIRPELILDHTGSIKLAAINSRFPFPVALITAVANNALHKATMTSSSLFAQQQLSCISSEISFLPALKDKLTRHSPDAVWIIADDEAQKKATLFATVMQIPFRVAHSADLFCNANASDGLFVKEPHGPISQITSCTLQLTEQQFLSLDDAVLQAIAHLSYNGHTLNDLRTIFLVSHPRFLQAICSDAYQFEPQQRQTLQKFILSETSTPVKQCQFQLMDNTGPFIPVSTVIMLSSFDSEFYGPALCSCTSGALTSFADGTLILPAMKLCQVPASSRFWCNSFEDANIPMILHIMKTYGLALVGVNEPLGPPERLKAFVSSLGAKLRYHKGEAVWNISPATSANGLPSKASSPSDKMFDVKTSLEFKLHTDCAFEELPPEWLVLAIIRSDHNGGGMFSLANVRDHVALLTEDQIQNLLHIKPKVEAPPGFEGPDGSPLYVIGPVLLERSKARFRYNNLNLELLTEEDAGKLSEAFNVLYNAMENTADNDRMIVPQQTLLFLNNHKFVHARTAVRDPKRHLQRVRFDMPNLTEIDQMGS